MRNLETERAKHALDTISDVAPSGNYLSYVKALPASIINNGLGQAMATLLSAAKGKAATDDDHRLLYEHIEHWLCQNDPVMPYPEKPGSDDTKFWLMKKITEGEQSSYIHAQNEAMAYLVWLKKFAKAFLEDKSQTGGQE